MSFHLLEMILDEEISMVKERFLNRLSAVTCVVRCQTAEESPANVFYKQILFPHSPCCSIYHTIIVFLTIPLAIQKKN